MNKLIKTGIYSYIPKIPAEVGRPAFCRVEYKLHTEIVFENGTVRFVSEYRPETVCYPAIPGKPAVPSQESVKPMTGWNAGAVSVVSFADNCQFSFNVPQNFIGIICGLSDGKDIRNYYHVAHGFLFKVNELDGSLHSYIIESGVIKQIVNVELMYRPRFMIRALSGEISYFAEIDGEFETVYKSNNTIKGNIFAESTLYMINDFVDNPEFISIDNNLAIAKITMTGGFSNIDSNLLNGVMPALTGELDVGNYFFNPLNLKGNFFQEFYGGFESAIPIQTEPFTSDPSPPIQIGVFLGMMPALVQLPMLAINGGVADLALTPIPLRNMIMSDRKYYAEFINQLPLPTGSFTSSNETGDTIDLQEYIVINTEQTTDSITVLLFTETIEIQDSIEVALVFTIDGNESIYINEQIDFATTLQLLFEEKIKLISQVSPQDTKNYQYAVNVANFALSLYDNFDFTSFANCNGVTYGIKSDGLYRLTGITDNGQLINAELDIGAKDWGMPNIKRVSSAYLGIRSDGDVYLKVVVDDKHTNVYRFEDTQSQRRTFMAKGVAGRYWRMNLVLEDITYAEIDSLEFEVGLSQRRIRR
ncbi:hypothetical protein [Entomomonas asaccharolytica]|uniref:hypothetical protein n=1 Tax=Entomomonas asaccharolytica TaxID=2785331 RepID=UPI0036360876